MDIINNKQISIYKTPTIYYPSNPPYHPSCKYPENKDLIFVNKHNPVYDAIRHSLFLLGLDKNNFGRESWNPFKTLNFIQNHKGQAKRAKPTPYTSNNKGPQQS